MYYSSVVREETILTRQDLFVALETPENQLEQLSKQQLRARTILLQYEPHINLVVFTLEM